MRRKSLAAVFFLFVGAASFAQAKISDLRWLDDGGEFAGREWLSWSHEEKACYVIGAELAYVETFGEMSVSNEICRDYLFSHLGSREKTFWNNFTGFKISLAETIKAIDTFYEDKTNADTLLMYVFRMVRPDLQKDANAHPK
jgi:hypothetical protein